MGHETRGMDWLSAPGEIGDPNYQALLLHKGMVTKPIVTGGGNGIEIIMKYIIHYYNMDIEMLEYEKQYVFLYFDSYSKCIPMFCFGTWPTRLTLVKVD